MTNNLLCIIIIIEKRKEVKTMITIKILFAVAIVIGFFAVILDEKRKTAEIIGAVATFFLFVIIVTNHAFF